MFNFEKKKKIYFQPLWERHLVISRPSSGTCIYGYVSFFLTPVLSLITIVKAYQHTASFHFLFYQTNMEKGSTGEGHWTATS